MNANRIFLIVIGGLILLWIAGRGEGAWSNPDTLARVLFLVCLLAFLLFVSRRGRAVEAGTPNRGWMALAWVGLFGLFMGGYALWTEQRPFSRSSLSAEGAPQLELRRERTGHFHVEARINGNPTRMLVDTGATVTAIPYEMAADLGISTSRLAYIIEIRTANGLSRAAPVVLEELALGPIVLRNLSATVSQAGALHEPLLGQNVLNRLQGYKVEGDRMILTGR